MLIYFKQVKAAVICVADLCLFFKLSQVLDKHAPE